MADESIFYISHAVRELSRIHRSDRDHVFAHSSVRWKISVVTQTVLRARPDLREEYEQVKRELAAERDEKDAYSKAKTEFIKGILQTARDADDLTFDFPIPDGA